MPRVVPIVEGKGDAEAVPLLLRRVFYEHLSLTGIDVLRPIRVPKHKLLKQGELEKAVEFAGRQTEVGDGVVILLDADDECPAEVAPDLLSRARAARRDREIRVVLAKKEYEAWFIAAAESIGGYRNLLPDLTAPADPESIRNAKGWLTRNSRTGAAYRETLDQPALTQVFDIANARRSPSFDKLCRDLTTLFP